MILTEEQREALSNALDYIHETRLPISGICEYDIAVIRAMIDSSSTVGFDLEKNRAAIDSAINSLLCEGWDNEASTVRRLVAEIERLRASLVEHEEHENQTHEVLGNILGTDDTLENVAKRAAARIKELEHEIENNYKDDIFNHLINLLVEERARGNYLDESQGECGGYWWDRKNTSDYTQNDYREKARQQLLTEGELGPDADAKPQSWQITKEEKRALSIILEYISYDADDDIEICSHAAVLRAMLREAE